jgi:Flp pilus assembly protein TadG
MRLSFLPIFATLKNKSEKLPMDSGFFSTNEVKPQKSYTSSRKRRGAAVVEFAVVAPLFFLLVFGMIEFGRMIMVQQVLTNASREGARRAVLDGATALGVKQAVIDNMGDAQLMIDVDNVDISPSDPSTAAYGTAISVTVHVPFSQVSWLPASMMKFFLPSGQTDVTLTATTVMRRETVQQ